MGIRGQVRSGQWPVPPPGEERGGGARKCQERWLSGNGCLAELRSPVTGRGHLLRKHTMQPGTQCPDLRLISDIPMANPNQKPKNEFDAVLSSSASPSSEWDRTKWALDLEGRWKLPSTGGCCKSDRVGTSPSSLLILWNLFP